MTMQADFYATWEESRVEEALGTSADTGLAAEEVTSRSKKYGKNPVLVGHKISLFAFLRIAMRQLSPLLMAVAILFAAISGYRTVAVVAGAFYAVFLLLLFLLYAYRELAAAQAGEDALPSVPVLREGKRCMLSPEQLLPGDILLLEPGAVIYTEARILRGDSLAVWTEIGSHRYTVAKSVKATATEAKLPSNMLKPGDIVRQGGGCAAVVAFAEKPKNVPDFSAELPPAVPGVCRIVSRIGFALVYLALFFRFFFGAPVAYPLLFLCGASLIAVSPPEWIILLLEAVFYIKNNLLMRKRRAFIVSPSAARRLAGADCFLLPGEAIFRSDFYRVRSFISADGRIIAHNSLKTPHELALISSCLLAVREKQSSEKEKYIHAFCKQHAGAAIGRLSSLSASGDGTCSFASFQTGKGQTRSFTLIGGEPECLLPHLAYASEEGRAHLMDLSTRHTLLSRIEKMRQNGFRVIAYAESQMLRGNDLGTAQDMKLLGFFVLSSLPDRDAEKTMTDWEREGKKAVFLHAGDDPTQLLASLPDAFPVEALDGAAPEFEEKLSAFAFDRGKNFLVLYRVNAQEKAQAVHILSKAMYTVAAYGEKFDDHRMVCAADIALSLPAEEAGEANGAVYEVAALHTPPKPGAIAAATREGGSMTSAFGAAALFLCTTFILRAVACIAGIFCGKAVLSPLFLLLLAVAVDFPAVLCIAYAAFIGNKGEGSAGSLSVFASFLGGAFFAALYSGIFAAYLSLHPTAFSFDSNGFLLVAFLILSNVVFLSYGKVRFSFPAFLFALYSLLLPAVFLYLGLRSVSGGLPYSSVLLFWAIVPTVIFTVAKGIIAALLDKHRMDKREEIA